MSEHDEQADLISWLMDQLPDFPEIHPLFFANPNGAWLAGGPAQRARQMNKLKAEGFTPGVADLSFLCGRGGYLGMVLEAKTAERRRDVNGGLSDSQVEFLHAARQQGYHAAVGYGRVDLRHIAENYLAMPRTQDMIYKALRMAEQGNYNGCIETLRQVVLVW